MVGAFDHHVMLKCALQVLSIKYSVLFGSALVSFKNCGTALVGSKKRMFGLSTELITKGKLSTIEIRVLTFRALALR